MATGRVPTTANSPLTAKGDLFGYSTTQARVAVGNDGETLLADSSTSTGLRYQAPKVQNGLYNSSFQIWQRGTSFTSANSYNADRYYKGIASANTVTRQLTNDTTNLPNIQYCLRSQRNSGSTVTAALEIVQNLETLDSIKFVGRTVTFSFFARKGADFSAAALAANIFSGTGTDQNLLGSGYTGQATVASGSHTLTTTWQRFSITGTVGTTATELAVYFNAPMSGTAGANDYFEITGLQLEVGSVATPYTSMTGTLQGELAAASRYYQRFSVDIDGHSGFFGNAYSTTAAAPVRGALVQMRTAPTSIDYASLKLYDYVNFATITALAIWSATESHTFALLATGATGLTQYRAYGLVSDNAAGGYIGFSAEL